MQHFIGNAGFSWTYTVNGTNGMYLGVSTTELNPSTSDGRARGFQLRCLSE
ncbi:hypothetical protein [uncultured Rikenella sp.]|uniref:hypothetical protein n=1 Tax=uncultured Rikenella sp. TaxID=368003 RepID=UPI0025F4FDCB|nr:hypothetical protein [uncultured Rikenella sp.]